MYYIGEIFIAKYSLCVCVCSNNTQFCRAAQQPIAIVRYQNMDVIVQIVQGNLLHWNDIKIAPLWKTNGTFDKYIISLDCCETSLESCISKKRQLFSPPPRQLSQQQRQHSSVISKRNLMGNVIFIDFQPFLYHFRFDPTSPFSFFSFFFLFIFALKSHLT